MTRIMVVDDSADYRWVLQIMADIVDGVEVVAEAATAEEALEKMAGAKPDLVLMDVRMPGMGGLQGTVCMRQMAPGVRVVLMSAENRPEYRAFAANEGAARFIPKEEINPDTLLEVAAA